MTNLSIKALNVQPAELLIVQTLLNKFIPEYEVWAFGSRVAGSPKLFSDLDLVLIGPNALPLDTRAELAHAFSESNLPWKVDLADWHGLSPEFRKIIQAGYLVLQTPVSSKPSK